MAVSLVPYSSLVDSRACVLLTRIIKVPIIRELVLLLFSFLCIAYDLAVLMQPSREEETKAAARPFPFPSSVHRVLWSGDMLELVLSHLNLRDLLRSTRTAHCFGRAGANVLKRVRVLTLEMWECAHQWILKSGEEAMALLKRMPMLEKVCAVCVCAWSAHFSAAVACGFLYRL